MATQDFDVAQTGYSRGEPRAWEEKITLTSPGFSDWILIPEQVRGIAVTVDFTGGCSGRMETTTDKVYEVKTGNPNPIPWPFGYVSTERTEVCKPCTAIRAEQVGAGSMIVTMRPQ